MMIKTRRNFLAALGGAALILPTGKFPTPANVYDHLKSCWSWYEAKDILNAFPVQISDLASRKEGAFTVVSDSRRRDLLRLNPAASGIWKLCDGRNSVGHMVRRLTDEYDISPGACVNDVVLTLRTLRRMGFISC
jgi:hypothetical protein